MLKTSDSAMFGMKAWDLTDDKPLPEAVTTCFQNVWGYFFYTDMDDLNPGMDK